MEQIALTFALAALGGGASALHGRPAKGILWAVLLAVGFLGGSFLLPAFARCWLWLGLIALAWGKEKMP
ncbi:MAG TPA: hypothetical protein ENJ54_02680 [Chloroflexi bacterium]|nr:hypothetical protein [Chloroflexota bacterium]